jgi:hypothetical protein
MIRFCRHGKGMKSTIFWDITPCSPLKVNGRFTGTYRVHIQGLGISPARNQRESRWQGDSTLHNHRCEILKSYMARECLTSCKHAWLLIWTLQNKCLENPILYIGVTSMHLSDIKNASELSRNICETIEFRFLHIFN